MTTVKVPRQHCFDCGRCKQMLPECFACGENTQLLLCRIPCLTAGAETLPRSNPDLVCLSWLLGYIPCECEEAVNPQQECLHCFTWFPHSGCSREARTGTPTQESLLKVMRAKPTGPRKTLLHCPTSSCRISSLNTQLAWYHLACLAGREKVSCEPGTRRELSLVGNSNQCFVKSWDTALWLRHSSQCSVKHINRLVNSFVPCNICSLLPCLSKGQMQQASATRRTTSVLTRSRQSKAFR